MNTITTIRYIMTYALIFAALSIFFYENKFKKEIAKEVLELQQGQWGPANQYELENLRERWDYHTRIQQYAINMLMLAILITPNKEKEFNIRNLLPFLFKGEQKVQT